MDQVSPAHPNISAYARYLFYRATRGGTLYGLTLIGRRPHQPGFAVMDLWPGDAEHGRDVLEKRFRYAGQNIQQTRNPWNAAGADNRWLRPVNGFEWLRDLYALGSDEAIQQGRALTEDWLARNDRLDAANANPASWTAAACGERLASWIRHWPHFYADTELNFRERLNRSIGRQARHLRNVVALDASDPVRLCAYKGLLAAGLCFPDLKLPMGDILDLLARELAIQILPDGGHVSRSPEDLLQALRELVEIRDLFRSTQEEIPTAVQTAIDRCAPMVRFFRHGDGGLAHFNGARDGRKTYIDEVLALAGSKGKALRRAPYSGYERVKAGTVLILVDSGTPAKRPYDRHAHAGTGSLEISVGKDRMVVNCGASLSTSSDWYAAQKATAAHSTMSIDDTNSSELLANGGIGRRRAQVQDEREDVDGQTWISLTHDGYRQRFGMSHTRRIYLSADGADLRGEDRLETAETSAKTDEHDCTVRFHLHPKVSVSLLHNNASALIRLPSGKGWRFRCSGAEIALEDSIYLGASGYKRAQQLVLRAHLPANQPQTIKWAFQSENSGV